LGVISSLPQRNDLELYLFPYDFTVVVGYGIKLLWTLQWLVGYSFQIVFVHSEKDRRYRNLPLDMLNYVVQ
jgi:hypothetical protein